MTFQTPADITNEALDQLGVSYKAIGNITDGTKESEVARRYYGAGLRGLLRAAHWGFARQDSPLLLLASANGLTPQGNPIASIGAECPWAYCYAWPSDGLAARWMPWRLEPVQTTPPLMTGLQNLPVPYQRLAPARFLRSSTQQFPSVTGSTAWNQLPDNAEGVGPTGRWIILTNVADAHLIYTRLVLSIEEWDALFREAFIALLAQRLALVAVEDRKEAIALRNAQIAIVKEHVTDARVADANDAGYPQSPDHVPDWIRSRRYGAARWGAMGLNSGWGDGDGTLGYGWEGLSFSDGSVF